MAQTVEQSPESITAANKEINALRYFISSPYRNSSDLNRQIKYVFGPFLLFFSSDLAIAAKRISDSLP